MAKIDVFRLTLSFLPRELYGDAGFSDKDFLLPFTTFLAPRIPLDAYEQTESHLSARAYTGGHDPVFNNSDLDLYGSGLTYPPSALDFPQINWLTGGTVTGIKLFDGGPSYSIADIAFPAQLVDSLGSLPMESFLAILLAGNDTIKGGGRTTHSRPAPAMTCSPATEATTRWMGVSASIPPSSTQRRGKPRS
jgi:hypothetical protein